MWYEPELEDKIKSTEQASGLKVTNVTWTDIEGFELHLKQGSPVMDFVFAEFQEAFNHKDLESCFVSHDHAILSFKEVNTKKLIKEIEENMADPALPFIISNNNSPHQILITLKKSRFFDNWPVVETVEVARLIKKK